MLRNTFINAQMGPLANFKLSKNQLKKVNILKWIDDVDQSRRGKKEGLRTNQFDNDLLRKKEVSKVDTHRNICNSDVTKTLRKRSLSLQQITGVRNIQLLPRSESGRTQSKFNSKKPSLAQKQSPSQNKNESIKSTKSKQD